MRNYWHKQARPRHAKYGYYIEMGKPGGEHTSLSARCLHYRRTDFTPRPGGHAVAALLLSNLHQQNLPDNLVVATEYRPIWQSPAVRVRISRCWRCAALAVLWTEPGGDVADRSLRAARALPERALDGAGLRL